MPCWALYASGILERFGSGASDFRNICSFFSRLELPRRDNPMRSKLPAMLVIKTAQRSKGARRQRGGGEMITRTLRVSP